MSMACQSYSLENDNQKIFLFEIKIKTFNNKFTIRKIKTEKEGILHESDDIIDDILNVKISIFSVENPNNSIVMKKNINFNEKNILLTSKKAIINIVNKNKFIIYYKLI
jgi:hypothetical protein